MPEPSSTPNDPPDAPNPDRPVALVTGASRGIGRATAIALGARGFDVAIAARTLTDGTRRLEGDPAVTVPGGLDSTAATIEAAGGRAHAIALDLLDRASVEALVPAVVDAFGRLDVVVNNGVYQGPGSTTRFVDLADDELGRLFEGNVFAQLALVRAALPHLRRAPRPTIVNMVSATAYQDPPGPIGKGGWGLGYAMTKAAFARVAPLLHVEHGDEGLRIFSVDPGFVVTERLRAAGHDAQYTAHFRPATPDVIGAVIAWLAADDDADELRGTMVMAQRECARRGLLPGWPPRT